MECVEYPKDLLQGYKLNILDDKKSLASYLYRC